MLPHRLLYVAVPIFKGAKLYCILSNFGNKINCSCMSDNFLLLGAFDRFRVEPFTAPYTREHRHFQISSFRFCALSRLFDGEQLPDNICFLSSVGGQSSSLHPFYFKLITSLSGYFCVPQTVSALRSSCSV